MGLFLKRVLVVVLAVQLSAPQVFAQSNTGSYAGGQDSDALAANEISQLAAETYKNPEDKAKFEQIQRVADAIEKGQNPREISETPTDIFHLSQQRVQILKKGQVEQEFSANDVRARYEAVPASDLRPIYNPETRELIFEGVNGIKADGTGGDVIARHIIPDIDMISMFSSNELLVFINSRGEVGMMDMGFVTKQIFRNPLPVIERVWKPDLPLNLSQANIKFMTPGVDPLSREAYTGYIYSRDSHGEPFWLNGDIRITSNQSGREEVLVLLPRTHFYLKGELAASMILSQLALVDPGSKAFELIKKIKEEAERTHLQIEEIPEGYNDVLRQFLGKIQPDQIEDLKSSANALRGYSERRFGRQNLLEAIEQFEEIKSNYAQKNDPLENINEIERRWYEHVSPVQVESPFKTSFSDVLSKTVQVTTSLKAIGVMVAGASTAYLGFPFAYESFEALQQIQTLNWFYLNALPEVLNHPYTVIPRNMDGVTLMEVINYRKYMILNMVALVSLWPAAHVVAFSFKKALNMTHNLVKDGSSSFASFIREFHKNWSPLSDWQIVTSFGMRVYSLFIYPMVRFSVEQLARQKSTFVAIENYQNPFQRILKDSELGRQLGLEKSMTLGLNNPMASSQNLKNQTELKLKAQGILKEQNMRRSQMAFLLATLTVSEKYGVDPATLIQLGSGESQLEELAQIFDTKRKKSEWFLAAKRVYEMLQQEDVRSTVSQVDVKEFGEYYEKARSIAESVHNHSRARLVAETNWVRFKRAPFWMLNNMPFVSGGMRDYKFLNTIYTNKFVSGQVHKEFYIDHLMVIGIVALTPGEAGRANYDKPHNLAADPHGLLWSTGPHLNDTVMNTYIHFFVTGAKTAMVYQSIKARSDSLPARKESGKGYENPDRMNLVYDPLEDFKYLSVEREEGLIRSTWDWTKALLNFPESRLGEFMMKSLHRRLTTIQGGFLTFMIFQMAFIDNRLFSDALMAYLLMFSAAYWRYAWPWDPVQRGNSMIDQRFEAKNDLLKSAKEAIHEALRIENPQEAQVEIQRAYNQMLALYTKENKGVLSRLRAVSKAFDPQYRKQILEELNHPTRAESLYYYGLLARLSLAMKTKDRESEEFYRKGVIRMLGGEGIEEMSRLSTEGLLNLSITHPPVYTKPSSLLSAATTFGAAAGTTIMAISLLTETTNVVEKPTWSYVLTWTVANFIFFGMAYLATGAKPWNFYLEKWESLKNRFRRGAFKGEESQDVSSPAMVSCRTFFS